MGRKDDRNFCWTIRSNDSQLSLGEILSSTKRHAFHDPSHADGMAIFLLLWAGDDMGNNLILL